MNLLIALVPDVVADAAGVDQITFAELKSLAVSGRILGRLLRYNDATVFVASLQDQPRLWIIGLLARLLSRRMCVIEDTVGSSFRVTFGYLAASLAAFVRDAFAQRRVLHEHARDLARVSAMPRSASLELSNRPLYLRTDLTFGMLAGGSVGHIAGVLNNLSRFSGKPRFVTTATIPTVAGDTETYLALPGPRYVDFHETRAVDHNSIVIAVADEQLKGEAPAFVYQRYSRFNYAGLALAREHGVPLVTEYNGSEVWIARNWGGKRLKHEDIALAIEDAMLQRADLVVVVSEPMRQELLSGDVEDRRILVNPNGVDADVYRPDVAASAVRERYGFEDKTVIGFIGTFGPWHGADVLPIAYADLLRRRPELRETTRLLMVGTGATMGAVLKSVEALDIAELTTLTGIVPQADGPAHLAAMDILCSPHVPNPDGTSFFGSPTKLFEYMAMGRGIVASDLDQIGEVLEHERTAILVEPGNVEDLSRGIERLVDDRGLRVRLGAAAREEALAHYTWRQHTQRIVEKLRQLCPAEDDLLDSHIGDWRQS